MSRRTFLVGASALAGVHVVGAPWRNVAFAGPPAVPGAGPYGPLQTVDANGLQLPVGFTSRVVAVTGEPVGGTGHTWHQAPDGGACFPTASGGWIYVSNAELGNQLGGVSAIEFDSSGATVAAYSILSGTNRNCSGGTTPWGTWLSCEEAGANGKVYECDPSQPGNGVVRLALGKCNHEAAAVDPQTGDVYLTEDASAGRLYRFAPNSPGDLSSGQLFAAAVNNGVVSWVPTSPDAPDRQNSTSAFNGGEGIFLGDRTLYFATKGDRRIWELDLTTQELSVAYDCLANPGGALTVVDAVNVHEPTGRVFVAEDGGNMELAVMADRNGQREVAAFCRFVGHGSSEVTGTAFTPDGSRMYLSSQRGTDGTTGVTVEITGPFATEPGPLDPVIIPVQQAAYVRGGTNANTNFSTGSLLQACFNGSAQYTRRSYLGVDTSNVAGGVSQAFLWVNARMSSGDASPMEVLGVEPGWSSTSLTWTNRPTPSPTPIATFTVAGTSAAWYRLDVTDHVVSERAAGNSSVAFVVAQTERNGRLGYIASPRHPSNQPYLEVLPGDTPPVAPVAIALTAGSYVRGGTFENTNLSSSYLHQVCNNGSPQYTRWTYLAVPAASVPSGAVARATLSVWARMSSGPASPMSVAVATAGWNDGSITWTNRPQPVANPVATFEIASTTDERSDIDVTSLVAAARAAGAQDITFVIGQTQRNGRLGYINTASRSGREPLLTIQPA